MQIQIRHGILSCQLLVKYILNSINWAVQLKSRGWLGGAKVSCILRLRGAQLILSYSWARLAILMAGNGRGECFDSVFSLSFLFLFCLCPSPSSPSLLALLSFLPFSLSLSFISSSTSSSLFSPFLLEMTKMTHKDWHVVKPQRNQSTRK